MLYRTGETIEYWAFYTSDGSGATGLTVTATVYDNTGSIETPTVSDIGGGLYMCSYTPESDGIYICVFSTEGSVDQADIGGIAYRGTAGVNNLDVTISSRFDPAEDEVDIGKVKGIAVSSVDDFKAAASDIWEYATRTLTDFGALVGDVWSYVERTLTAGTKDAEIDDIKLQTDRMQFNEDNDIFAAVGEIEVGDVFQAAVRAAILSMRDDKLQATMAGQVTKNIEVYYGDNVEIELYVKTSETGDTADLSDAVATLTVVDSSNEVVLEKELTITDPPNGVLLFELEELETERDIGYYKGDIVIRHADWTRTIWNAYIVIKEHPAIYA